MRIAIAGFQHETNTFVTEPTDFAAFEQADSWPELLAGSAVIDQTRGMNLPITGFVDAAIQNAELIPILWCAAEPSGKVTDEAFETIVSTITRKLEQVIPVDAVYLDLHGAMVTQSFDDGEAALLARLRGVLGPDVPLVASLDMHANISQKMVDLADVLTVYRTYPHTDMADTGARAWHMLRRIVEHGAPKKAWRQADFLIPLHAQHTGAEPARTLYHSISNMDGRDQTLAEIALGFTASDISFAGPSLLAYAPTQREADVMATQLSETLKASQHHFKTDLLDVDAAVSRALSAPSGRPVVIADVQDNPGAGASSDTTALIRALVKQQATGAILGLVHDPELATTAHALGTNRCFEARIGGRGPGDTPFFARVRVRHLSDGQCVYSGQMYGGGISTLGPSAALELVGHGITIVVTSIRNQCLDLAHFFHFNLDPRAARIVCVKSTAHFRADFEPIAQEVLLTKAPGQFPCVLKASDYKNLRATAVQNLSA